MARVTSFMCSNIHLLVTKTDRKEAISKDFIAQILPSFWWSDCFKLQRRTQTPIDRQIWSDVGFVDNLFIISGKVTNIHQNFICKHCGNESSLRMVSSPILCHCQARHFHQSYIWTKWSTDNTTYQSTVVNAFYAADGSTVVSTH